jgi:hypothetical protein
MIGEKNMDYEKSFRLSYYLLRDLWVLMLPMLCFVCNLNTYTDLLIS